MAFPNPTGACLCDSSKRANVVWSCRFRIAALDFPLRAKSACSSHFSRPRRKGSGLASRSVARLRMHMEDGCGERTIQRVARRFTWNFQPPCQTGQPNRPTPSYQISRSRDLEKRGQPNDNRNSRLEQRDSESAPSLLKLSIPWRSRVRDHVPNIRDARQKHQQPFESQPKPRMRHGPILPQIHVPPIIFWFEFVEFHVFQELLKAFLALRAAYNFADARHQHVHRGHGFLVVI